MRTDRATHMGCELKTGNFLSSLDCFQSGYWYLSLVLVKSKQTTTQSLEVGHFNEMEAVQFVDKWHSIFCPFYRGL